MSGGPDSPRVGQVNAGLQPGETGLLAVERDNLAVGGEPRGAVCGECVDQLRVAAVDAVAVARPQPRRAVAVPGRQRAHPVQFPLEHPPLVGEPRLGQGGQHHRPPPGRPNRGQRGAGRVVEHLQRAALCRSAWLRSACFGAHYRITLLHQQPLLAAAQPGRGQREPAGELAALEPHHHSPGAVLAGRDSPSNSAFSSGWSSVRTANRLSRGSSEGPFGTVAPPPARLTRLRQVPPRAVPRQPISTHGFVLPASHLRQTGFGSRSATTGWSSPASGIDSMD